MKNCEIKLIVYVIFTPGPQNLPNLCLLFGLIDKQVLSLRLAEKEISMMLCPEDLIRVGRLTNLSLWAKWKCDFVTIHLKIIFFTFSVMQRSELSIPLILFQQHFKELLLYDKQKTCLGYKVEKVILKSHSCATRSIY